MIIPPENLEDIARKFGFGKYAKKKIDDHTKQPEIQKHNFSDEDIILNGKTFYSEEKNNDGLYVGIPTALREALEYAGSEGVVASMPYLIAGKAKADATNYLWQNWFTALSEENIGIDKHGVFNHGKPVLIVVHGGGLWTPERIEKAYAEGLTDQYAGKLTEEEFNELLKGKLPNGKTIPVYNYEQFKEFKNIQILPTQKYAIVLNFDTAKSTKSDYHTKEEFMKNPIVIARAGGLEQLETYFNKTADYHPQKNKVGSWHKFKEINPSQYQGRLLFLNFNYIGLDGDDGLDYDGRFVGVASAGGAVGAPVGETR